MRETKPFRALQAERLKFLREQRGISVTDAALHLGRHRTFIWKIEHGAIPAPPDLIPKIAALYGVEEVDLSTFPAVSTRHELIELTLGLPEELLRPVVRELRRLRKVARSMAAPSTENSELPWQHVHGHPRAQSEKALKNKAG